MSFDRLRLAKRSSLEVASLKGSKVGVKDTRILVALGFSLVELEIILELP